MKKVILVIVIFLSITSGLFSKDILSYRASGFLNDFANVLDSENKNRLEYLLNQVEKQSGIEMAIVTVPSIGDYSIEEAAVELFQKWGIGKKGKDNGLLFITAIQERKVRIEVGYGLEEAIPDSLAGRLLDNYTIPYFRQNNFDQGIYATTLALIDRLNQYYNLNIDLTEKENNIIEDKEKESPFSYYITFLIVLFLLFRFFGPFFFLFFPGSFFGRGFYRGGFGSGGGSFGGGFGGFGGGMSGGGGASRGF